MSYFDHNQPQQNMKTEEKVRSFVPRQWRQHLIWSRKGKTRRASRKCAALNPVTERGRMQSVTGVGVVQVVTFHTRSGCRSTSPAKYESSGSSNFFICSAFSFFSLLPSAACSFLRWAHVFVFLMLFSRPRGGGFRLPLAAGKRLGNSEAGARVCGVGDR